MYNNHIFCWFLKVLMYIKTYVHNGVHNFCLRQCMVLFDRRMRVITRQILNFWKLMYYYYWPSIISSLILKFLKNSIIFILARFMKQVVFCCFVFNQFLLQVNKLLFSWFATQTNFLQILSLFELNFESLLKFQLNNQIMFKKSQKGVKNSTFLTIQIFLLDQNNFLKKELPIKCLRLKFETTQFFESKSQKFDRKIRFANSKNLSSNLCQDFKFDRTRQNDNSDLLRIFNHFCSFCSNKLNLKFCRIQFIIFHICVVWDELKSQFGPLQLSSRYKIVWQF
eukprot:TRINITY_DN6195_c1_g1_i11.p1 TRINITY_DN6195_c1_g1~~TRINITY_DN6195_c1_g1_i11.p1  ORF type:complete len:281 (-),score=-25.69 TRINITY_DN6195_c1_g1_i11:212-1054(-)